MQQAPRPPEQQQGPQTTIAPLLDVNGLPKYGFTLKPWSPGARYLGQIRPVSGKGADTHFNMHYHDGATISDRDVARPVPTIPSNRCG